MPRSMTDGFLWSRYREKRSWHSRRIRNPFLFVSDNRPMDNHIFADTERPKAIIWSLYIHETWTHRHSSRTKISAYEHFILKLVWLHELHGLTEKQKEKLFVAYVRHHFMFNGAIFMAICKLSNVIRWTVPNVADAACCEQRVGCSDLLGTGPLYPSIVRVTVFYFTECQPSWLPCMCLHVAVTAQRYHPENVMYSLSWLHIPVDDY